MRLDTDNDSDHRQRSRNAMSAQLRTRAIVLPLTLTIIFSLTHARFLSILLSWPELLLLVTATRVDDFIVSAAVGPFDFHRPGLSVHFG